MIRCVGGGSRAGDCDVARHRAGCWNVQRARDELSRFDGGGRRERRKIERAILSGATPAPEIIAHIENHYLIEA
jgi:hypothetical protein